ncbi:MAG TPA: ferredoxin [Phycisphaerae bacterium]|nr:ferredoxin [Phycisphaerae bacterium]
MAKYKIEINQETCVGDKACCEEAPETFRVTDGSSTVVNPDGDPPEDILAAARNCIHEAITLHDSETGEKVWPMG